jgi:hypothetical protein
MFDPFLFLLSLWAVSTVLANLMSLTTDPPGDEIRDLLRDWRLAWDPQWAARISHFSVFLLCRLAHRIYLRVFIIPLILRVYFGNRLAGLAAQWRKHQEDYLKTRAPEAPRKQSDED